ncbi:MAG TPA: nucleotidyltransferase family protein [Silvibacterium sp.]|nr:nucleotidyltransferase family protein [Silvibacterium sp.]
MSDSLSLKQMIVRFLGGDRPYLLEQRDEEEWRTNLRWLDRSGLALPLAARLEVLGPNVAVPDRIRDELRTRLEDNEKRMASMLRFFEEANTALAASGVQYCCVKGFSLIPDCFAGIRERHQVDLDFLIAPRDSSKAQYAIEALGYRAQRISNSGELRFTKGWKKHLGVNAYLYQLPEPPPIELHTCVWEPEAEEIEFPSLSGFFDATETHKLSGVQFPRLQQAYQFVYLVLHIFRHLFGSWIRLISLYEVSILIRSRCADDHLWNNVRQIVSKEESLASAFALILGLVDFAFTTGLPYPLRELYTHNLSTESALWIERYSRDWLFSAPPGNKLALLVQKQFCLDRYAWRRYLRRRLLPVRKPHELSDETMTSGRATLAYRAEDTWYKISRAWYHMRSDCEYLVARLKWERLTQPQTRSVPRVADEL